MVCAGEPDERRLLRRRPADGWLAVGVSLFATAFSSLSFVALPREGAYADYHLLVTYLLHPADHHAAPVVAVRPAVSPARGDQRLRVPRNPLQPARCGGWARCCSPCYAIGWMGSMVYAIGLILKAVLHLDAAAVRVDPRRRGPVRHRLHGARRHQGRRLDRRAPGRHARRRHAGDPRAGDPRTIDGGLAGRGRSSGSSTASSPCST